MAEVASRELRNNTRGVLERVEAGETLTVTVDGRPVVEISPLRARPQWLSRREFVSNVLRMRPAEAAGSAVAGSDQSAEIEETRELSRGLVDSSLFLASEAGDALELERLPDELGISVMTIAKLHQRVLAATGVTDRGQRLATLTAALRFDPIEIDQRTAERFAQLREELKESKIKLNANDSWIAATALSAGVPLVSATAEYDGVGGLELIKA
jgi:prevent-host-death family protein